MPPIDQELLLADWELDRTRHGECGHQIDECSDPERTFYPQRYICYASMEKQAAAARYQELHEDRPYHDGSFSSWSDRRTREHPYRFDEGVSIGVALVDHNPDDDFLTPGGGSLWRAAPEQVDDHPQDRGGTQDAQ